VKWYKKRENYGNVLLVISLAFMQFFPKESIWFGIGSFIGVVLSAFGYRAGYKVNNLNKLETKVMDKLPNSITGKKGSLKNDSNSSR